MVDLSNCRGRCYCSRVSWLLEGSGSTSEFVEEERVWAYL